MFGIGGEFTYQDCGSCGSLQIAEIPEDLSPYYSDQYYSLQKLVYSPPLRNFLKQLRMRLFLATGSKRFEPSFGYWLKKLKPKFTDRIADVGCGNGQLLYELSVSGFKNLRGFDPFIPKDQIISNSLSLLKKGIEEADEMFDVIMLHHSFEHMPDPDVILKACYNKLNPGGKLLIRTPVTNSQVWKEEGTFWVQLDAPRHLIIPSTQGFKKASEACGFQLEDVVFDSDGFQFWGTELYKMGIPLNPELAKGKFSKETLDEFHKKALRYNQEGKGDQVCFYLTKPA